MHLRTLPGIKASIRSGGTELKEYDDPHGGEDEGVLSKITARTYIEAIDGAMFEIHIEALPSYMFDCYQLCAKVSVDGKFVRMVSILPRHRQNSVPGWEEELSGSEIYLRKFLFSKIETSEENANTKKPDNVEKIGEIEAQIYRMHETGPAQPFHPTLVQETGDKLSEKQLKGRAVSHSTSYGARQRVPMPKYGTAVYVDGSDKPLAVLKFSYKSKAALQSMLIIPRTPSPPPRSPLRNRSDANKKVSSTQTAVQVKTEKRIKRERDNASQPGPAKKRTHIDLTQGDVNEVRAVTFKRFETADGKPGIDLT